MGKEVRDSVWTVWHPDHRETVVRAADWRLATVEAAQWWGVPWKKVAADCTVVKIGDVPRNVCVECGKIFHAPGLRCELCECKARDHEASRPANERRYWREMRPK